MDITSKKINIIIKQKSLSLKKLAKLIDYSHGGLSNMINKKTPFTEKLIEKLLPILEVSREEFDSWIIVDKYSKEIIELAIKVKEETKVKRKQLILTAMVDAILEEKGLSRTALAKQIKYSQSGLNRMIVGKISLSKSVLERMSEALEVSQNEITGWIVADSYNLDTLKMAYTNLK